MFSFSETHEHIWQFSSWHAAAFRLLKSAAALLLPLRYLTLIQQFQHGALNFGISTRTRFQASTSNGIDFVH